MQPTLLVIREVPLCGLILLRFLEKKAWDLIGDDRFCGTASADPTQQAYFGIGLYSPTAVDESGHSFPFKVTITYYAVMTEPKWFTTS